MENEESKQTREFSIPLLPVGGTISANLEIRRNVEKEFRCVPRGAIAFTFPLNTRLEPILGCDSRYRGVRTRRKAESGGKKSWREKGMERSGDKKEQFGEQEEKARALIGFEAV